MRTAHAAPGTHLNWRIVTTIHLTEAAPGNQVLDALLDEYFTFREQHSAENGRSYHRSAPLPRDFDGIHGLYLVAHVELDGVDAVAGCVGIRRLDPLTWEVKNLWVRHEHRSHAVAKSLLLEAERRARLSGAHALRLDTHESLTAAVGLYRSRGFRQIPAYNTNPNASLWFEKPLTDDAPATPAR